MHKKSFLIFVFILSAGIAGSVFLFSTNGFNKSDNMNQIIQQPEIKDTSKPVDFYEEYFNSLVLFALVEFFMTISWQSIFTNFFIFIKLISNKSLLSGSYD